MDALTVVARLLCAAILLGCIALFADTFPRVRRPARAVFRVACAAGLVLGVALSVMVVRHVGAAR